ncbi:unnamed protein product [Cuscuta europaea]|uniref:Uncharacterized protein n=1 Tax=Cuscuta europaea TaxID=41803 RepID=A0A9P1DY99_CUSEU|nr:unnamed protein product [Cuscuta europaea]
MMIHLLTQTIRKRKLILLWEKRDVRIKCAWSLQLVVSLLSFVNKLADQLTKVPKAVTWAEEFLASLKDDVPVKYAHYFKYIERHWCSAMAFWFEPVIILQLIKALKESAPLVDVFHKYSKGAQLLRC